MYRQWVAGSTKRSIMSSDCTCLAYGLGYLCHHAMVTSIHGALGKEEKKKQLESSQSEKEAKSEKILFKK